MNNNEPLLHFGDENEETNINSQSNNTPNGGHIRFGESEDTSVHSAPTAQPAQKPAQPQQAPTQQPRPAQPQQPAQQPRPANTQKKQPQKIQNPNDMLGKMNLRINLIVVNGAGVVLPQFKVDNTVVKSGQEITFNESREVYELTVGADGYKDRRIQITQTDLLKGEKRVSLATQLQSLVVSFNTPDGIKRGSIDIDQTNAIYQYIKDASHTDTPLNELQIGGVGGTHKTPSGKPNFIPYIVALAIGLILGIGITSMFKCSSNDKDKTEVVDEENKAEVVDEEVKPEDQPTLNTESEENVDQQKEEEKENVESTDSEEENKAETEENKEEEKPETAAMGQNDVDYFKQADVWDATMAKTDEGKRLIANFRNGNIDYIIGDNGYNKLGEKQRNGYYNKILADLKRINAQSNKGEVKEILVQSCKDGKINLNGIYTKIHIKLLK